MDSKELKISNTYFVEEAAFTNLFKEGNFQINPLISKKIKNIDEKTFDVSLKFEVKSSETKPFPFDIRIVVTIRSHFIEKVLEGKELEEYLNITSVRMLYPFLRSCVSNLCTSCLVNPIVLPVADITQILKEE